MHKIDWAPKLLATIGICVYAKLSEENIIAEIEIAERNKMYLETNQDINEIRAAVYIELGNELKSRMRND